MASWSRNLCLLALGLQCFTLNASADIKIKTRTSVMGHATESTVYIKGGRERREMSFGGRFSSTTITQCDQKRFITITSDNCSAMGMGGGSAACPAAPAMPAMGGMGGEPEPAAAPRKGGVLTITRTSTDTGERQELFGYKARHIKSSMSTESSPDACNKTNTRIETDGWYADLSVAFSCSDESVRALACGGMGPRARGQAPCQDRIVMKGSGSAALGYPLKQTTTITSEHGTFTTNTEVIELANVALDPALFEMPPSCRVVETPNLNLGEERPAAPQPETSSSSPPPVAPKAPAQPATAPAPAVAAKAAGVVRVGIVKLKDSSGQDLPTENLRINLMSEITRHNLEAIPLDVEVPQTDVVKEARDKQCDYVLYTTLKQLSEPGSALPAAMVPKGVTLDPSNFQSVTGVTLYKISKPLPEIKDLNVAADAPQLNVNAVMATFEKESDKVAEHVAEDAHPKAAAKTPGKQPATHPKPK